MAKLNIKSIEFKNFLSYGNYVTKIDIDDFQGPTLILGNTDSNADRSNGAGKSSLITAFIWCLFGRTILNSNPGDKIINWNSKSDCFVKITTRDNWEILRTRNVDGHSELMIFKDGLDETKSTTTNTQKFINKLFGLNYNIFVSSIFCGQFGKSFMEMSPSKRKETMEDLLELNKLNKYASIAKEKWSDYNNLQKVAVSQIEVIQSTLDSNKKQLELNNKYSADFEIERTEKINKITQKINKISLEISKYNKYDIKSLKKEWESFNKITSKIENIRNQIESNNYKLSYLRNEVENLKASDKPTLYDVPDINVLKKLWDAIDKANNYIEKYKQEIENIDKQLLNIDYDLSKNKSLIDNWQSMADKKCESCEQIIDDNYAAAKIETIQRINDKLDNDRNKILSRRKSVECKIDAIINKINSNKPSMSIDEAQKLLEINRQLSDGYTKILVKIDNLNAEIDKLVDNNSKLSNELKKLENYSNNNKPGIEYDELIKLETNLARLYDIKKHLDDELQNISKSENPYSKVIDNIKHLIDENSLELSNLNSKVASFDSLINNYNYIYKAYSDRRKIKGWLLSEIIPFLNDRIKYYLGMFNLNIDIKFNHLLNIETNAWTYDFCSGGERKRIDLAIMFGLYDLYVSLYGKQCNIIVFDEVDSRLDSDGVSMFADIIHELSNNNNVIRPDTIFVISHKNELKDYFHNQLIIDKKDGFSKIIN